MIQADFQQLPHGKGLKCPAYESENSAGMDLMAAVAAEEEIILKPGQRLLVPTGFAMALAPGYEAQVRPRSGLAWKHGVTILNSPGTIDADYRGEVKVILINHGSRDFIITRGMRIAQMVIAPVTRVQWEIQNSLEETARGAGGFGSTGLNS